MQRNPAVIFEKVATIYVFNDDLVDDDSWEQADFRGAEGSSTWTSTIDCSRL